MRTTPITPNAGGTVSIGLSLIRDERRTITVEGMAADPLLLTIGSTPGGAPLIEVPGTGQFDLHPAVVQALAEGATYYFNVWLEDPAGDLIQIAAGTLDIGASIAPAGVDATTTFLSGFGQIGAPTQIVTLTQAAYAALAVKDAATIYIIAGSV